MILSNGTNHFENNVYSFWEWSAPILQTYDEVLAKVKELKLVGRTIKGFYAVGMAYNWTDDGIGEAVYLALERLIEEKRVSRDGPFPFLPEGVFLSRYAEIDEPFLIEFEDGDILCVEYREGGSVRMELNTVPRDIRPSINEKNFHSDSLFSDLIGKRITAVEITTSTECDEFTGLHGISMDEREAYITRVALVCRKQGSGEAEKLEFSSWCDYGIVAQKDGEGADRKIHAPEIRSVVEGFIDEEVLNLPDEYFFDE